MLQLKEAPTFREVPGPGAVNIMRGVRTIECWVPGGDSNYASRPRERTLGCAPGVLITSVGRTHSKNGRPDLLSVPTRANVVSGRQYGRLLAHTIQQIPLATTPSGSAGRKSLRAQPAPPPRSSDDVSRSHPG